MNTQRKMKLWICLFIDLLSNADQTRLFVVVIVCSQKEFYLIISSGFSECNSVTICWNTSTTDLDLIWQWQSGTTAKKKQWNNTQVQRDWRRQKNVGANENMPGAYRKNFQFHCWLVWCCTHLAATQFVSTKNTWSHLFERL